MKMRSVAALVVVLVASCGVRDAAEHPVKKCPTQVFVDSLWASGDQCLRGGMVEDLVAKGSLIGLSRNEVVSKLGPPSQETEEIVAYLVNWRQSDQFMLIYVGVDSITHRVDNAWVTD